MSSKTNESDAKLVNVSELDNPNGLEYRENDVPIVVDTDTSENLTQVHETEESIPEESTELAECEIPEAAVEVIEDEVPNMSMANDFLSNNVNMELLGKVQNLTTAFSETVVPMQEQNSEMKQYIDEANAYIDSLEEKVNQLEKENEDLKSRLQE